MKIEIIYSSVVAAGILSWLLIGLDPQTFGLLTNKISESLLKLQMRTVSRLTTKIRRKLLHILLMYDHGTHLNFVYRHQKISYFYQSQITTNRDFETNIK